MKNTIDPYWYVSAFEVYTDSTPDVFANGHQQVKLTVGVKAINGEGQEVALTPTEVANTKMVMYRRVDQVLPFDHFDSLGWSVSRHYQGYDYFPRARPANDRPVSAGQPTLKNQDKAFHYYEFYVSCNALSAVGQTVDLAFMVKGDNGDKFCTNGQSWYADGTSHNSPPPQQPYARIHVHRPKSYPVDNFILSALTDMPDSPTLGAIRNRLATLSLQESATHTIALRETTLSPEGMIQWSTPLEADTHASFTGYVEPGRTEINWNKQTAVPTGNIPLPELKTPIVDKASLILCTRVDIKRTPDVFSGPCPVSIVDAYGTHHRLKVQFKLGDRHVLELMPA
ncbi:hypothetical protein [Pseudomonas sp. dw_358]|uniref:hypothetical protein n=1 Tax=Pseudomonas sp. dw_358 TaxID=2720083 RepID=UPI001BD5B0D3|nr:hypothetical protein [Pseudomonas sp. dw_358]